jgi:hypothetical protein
LWWQWFGFFSISFLVEANSVEMIGSVCPRDGLFFPEGLTCACSLLGLFSVFVSYLSVVEVIQPQGFHSIAWP